MYLAARDECSKLTALSKTYFYPDKLQHTDNKNIFSIVKSLSGKPSPSCPQHASAVDCSNAFSDYFTARQPKFAEGSHPVRQRITPPREPCCFVTPIDTVKPTNVHEIMVIITRTRKTWSAAIWLCKTEHWRTCDHCYRRNTCVWPKEQRRLNWSDHLCFLYSRSRRYAWTH